MLELLRPFVVTSWHGAGEPEMSADVQAIYTKSSLSKDPDRSNMFVFVLDSAGRVIHEFHGLSGGRRGGKGRSDWLVELQRAREKLKLPVAKAGSSSITPLASLPDLKCASPTTTPPAGVRLFIRGPAGQGTRTGSHMPVVETVAMDAGQWKALAWPEKSKDIPTESLRGWFVYLYPPAIRTVDQKVPFRPITGSLKLEPAGADDRFRYAVLRGDVRLQKDGASQSGYEGRIEAMLTYARGSPDVKSVRGVVEGTYLYRVRGSEPIKLNAAIESRPE
ncbi:MAG TPA: hypothetical protein VI454_04180 [Verrucomicrobiae bacterium]